MWAKTRLQIILNFGIFQKQIFAKYESYLWLPALWLAAQAIKKSNKSNSRTAKRLFAYLRFNAEDSKAHPYPM